MSNDSYTLLTQRLGAKVEQGRRRRWRFAMVAVTTGLLVIIGVWRFERVAVVAGFALAESTPDLAWHGDDEHGLQVVRGEALLIARDLRARIRVQAGTRLRREGRAIRMFAGRADFDIDPRHQPDAVRVLVSSGAIEVLGTQFLVEQQAETGTVWLGRGRIRFVGDSGAVRVLEVGQTLRWPLLAEAPPPPPVAAAAPAGSRKPEARTPKTSPPRSGRVAEPAPAPSADAARAYLTEIDALRIRHDYPALAARLAAALQAGVREPLRESLSLELCDVLVRRVRDRGRACAQVAEHLRRYPVGLSTPGLRESAIELGCSP